MRFRVSALGLRAHGLPGSGLTVKALSAAVLGRGFLGCYFIEERKLSYHDGYIYI